MAGHIRRKPVWYRVHRHLAYDSRVARLMVWWLGCVHWTRHNWMQE